MACCTYPYDYTDLLYYNHTDLLYCSIRLYGSVVQMVALFPLLFFNSAQLVIVPIQQKLCLNSLSPIFILLAKTLIYQNPNLSMRCIVEINPNLSH